jgi:CHASE2 domain-containing sensor protein
MNENLFLLMILVLWGLLVGVLGRNAYFYYKRKNKKKMILVLLVLAAIILLSGELIVFLAWSLACYMGANPFSCLL